MLEDEELDSLIVRKCEVILNNKILKTVSSRSSIYVMNFFLCHMRLFASKQKLFDLFRRSPVTIYTGDTEKN